MAKIDPGEGCYYYRYTHKNVYYCVDLRCHALCTGVVPGRASRGGVEMPIFTTPPMQTTRPIGAFQLIKLKVSGVCVYNMEQCAFFLTPHPCTTPRPQTVLVLWLINARRAARQFGDDAATVIYRSATYFCGGNDNII